MFLNLLPNNPEYSLEVYFYDSISGKPRTKHRNSNREKHAIILSGIDFIRSKWKLTGLALPCKITN